MSKISPGTPQGNEAIGNEPPGQSAQQDNTQPQPNYNQQQPGHGQQPQPGHGQQLQPGHGQQPQPGYEPQPPGQQQTTITVQSTMTEQPMNMSCPYCHTNIVTRCVHKNGILTFLLIIGLILIGCWFGCCLIPLCIDQVKDVEHNCPRCNRLIGCKKRI